MNLRRSFMIFQLDAASFKHLSVLNEVCFDPHRNDDVCKAPRDDILGASARKESVFHSTVLHVFKIVQICSIFNEDSTVARVPLMAIANNGFTCQICQYFQAFRVCLIQRTLARLHRIIGYHWKPVVSHLINAGTPGAKIREYDALQPS